MIELIGQSIGQYHVVEQLGAGGMAIVYKAFDTRLERDVAVKVIRKGVFGSEVLERVLKRFDREAKTLAKLTHPNIVSIIDYGEFEGSPYLVMPFLVGGTLKQKLGKPMPYSEAARLLLPIADALAYAHSQNVVHRDVKPANILITASGQPLLTDFGVARLLENEDATTLTGTGVGIGTPEYMAPEQGLGREIDGRADIYSLGVVFYELVTGHKPYTADTPMAVVLKQSTEPLPRPSLYVAGLPEKVEQVLYKALAKKPEDRFQTMQEFEKALEGLERESSRENNKDDIDTEPVSKKRIPDEEIQEEQESLNTYEVTSEGLSNKIDIGKKNLSEVGQKEVRKIHAPWVWVALISISVLFIILMIGKNNDLFRQVATTQDPMISQTKDDTSTAEPEKSAISTVAMTPTQAACWQYPKNAGDGVISGSWYTPLYESGTYQISYQLAISSENNRDFQGIIYNFIDGKMKFRNVIQGWVDEKNIYFSDDNDRYYWGVIEGNHLLIDVGWCDTCNAFTSYDFCK